MGARSGNGYLSAIRKLKARVRFGGEWIADPITHPFLRRHARLIASLYDAQIEHPALMTQRLPDGDRIGWSYALPASAEEVRKRGLMLRVWSEQSIALESAAPDEGNLVLSALAGAGAFFGAADGVCERNLEQYYLAARSHDWCIATTLAPSRAATPPFDDLKGLHYTAQTGGSVALSGASPVTMPCGLIDEVLVLPDPDGAQPDGAIVCAIAANTPGVSFDCPQQADVGAALDFRIVCEGATILPSRIFLCGDLAQYRAAWSEAGIADVLQYRRAICEVARIRLRPNASAENTGRTSLAAESIERVEALLSEAEQKSGPDRRGHFVPARDLVQRALETIARVNPAE